MHILEPHNWVALYGEPHSADERKRNYDRSLVASDKMVSTLLGAFAQRPADRAPVVIVSADHGEALGEHNQPYHGTDLRLADPRPASDRRAGHRNAAHRRDGEPDRPRADADGAAGFEAARGGAIDGHSFADLAAGRRPNDAGSAFAAMIRTARTRRITAVVQGKYKLIDNNVLEVTTRAPIPTKMNLVGQKGVPLTRFAN
jgi:hypothetical protein